MKRLYIATNSEEYLKYDQAGLSVVQLDFTKPLEADEFVFIGPGAREAMLEFRARGVAAEELSYVHEGKIRHFHWDLYSSADMLPDWKPGQYKPCGIDGLSKVVRWRFPELIVAAGPYSGGKSLFLQILAQDFVRATSLPASITAWEDQGSRIKAGLIRYRESVMREEGEEFKKNFLSMFQIAKIDSSRDRLLKDYMDLVEYQAKRFGTKFFVFDPWNEFDHQKSQKQNETEYVREVMKDFRRLVDKLSIILALSTHVSAEYIGNDGSIKPFKIAHSFGSSQFGNKADRGFCVMRTDKWAEDGETHMLVRQDKVKEEDQPGMDAMGKRATMLFKYYPSHNTIYYDGKASSEESVQKIWRG